MATTHFNGPVYSKNGFQTGTGSVESLTVAQTLTAAQAGKTYLLDGGTGLAITLPSAATKGLYFKFIVTAAFSTDYVFTATPADSFEGCVIEAGAVQDVDAADTITLEDGVENIGDFIEFFSTGTYWIVFGNFLTAASVTPAG
jgi:hypothetical protein